MLSNTDADAAVDRHDISEGAKADDEYDSGATTGGSDKLGNLSDSDVEKGVQDLRLSSIEQQHKICNVQVHSKHTPASSWPGSRQSSSRKDSAPDSIHRLSQSSQSSLSLIHI